MLLLLLPPFIFFFFFHSFHDAFWSHTYIAFTAGDVRQARPVSVYPNSLALSLLLHPEPYASPFSELS